MPNTVVSKASGFVNSKNRLTEIVSIDDNELMNNAETAILSYYLMNELFETVQICGGHENFEDLPYYGDELINPDQFWNIQWSYGYDLIDNLVVHKDDKIFLQPYKTTTIDEFYQCIANVLDCYFKDEYNSNEYTFYSIPYKYAFGQFNSCSQGNSLDGITEKEAFDLASSIVLELKKYDNIFLDREHHIEFLNSQISENIYRWQVISKLLLSKTTPNKNIDEYVHIDFYDDDFVPYYSCLIKNAYANEIMLGRESSFDKGLLIVWLDLCDYATNAEMLAFFSRYLKCIDYKGSGTIIDNDYSDVEEWLSVELNYLGSVGIDCSQFDGKWNDFASAKCLDYLMQQIN